MSWRWSPPDKSGGIGTNPTENPIAANIGGIPTLVTWTSLKSAYEEICRVYALALEWAAAGIQVHSTDEMTGIQACERTRIYSVNPVRTVGIRQKFSRIFV
jgi:hypothetical protein